MTEPNNTPVFNPADYPRRYVYATTRLDWAVGYFIVMACFFVGTYALTYHYLQNPLPDDYVAFSYAGLMCGLMIAVLMIHRTEVEMTPYEIRIRKKFTDKTLKRQDIRGWCHTRSWIRDGDFICLIPLHPKNKTLMLKIDDFKNLVADDAFHAWYKSLPDLGQKEKEKYYEAVARTKPLGRTRDERLRNMGYATRILDWHRYLFITGFMGYFVLPNAYLPPLTGSAVIILMMLTVLGIAVIYRYPVLLTEPPVGVGKKSYAPFLIVSGWGAVLFMWFGRDAVLNGTGLDFRDISLNLYMVGIFLVLFMPLLADRNWKQMPKRMLWDIYFVLLATGAFYFYGNIVLDQTEPLVQATTYEEHAFGNPNSKIPYAFADDRMDGKQIAGCEYRYPGAFGTPWLRYAPCPENFQKAAPAK